MWWQSMFGCKYESWLSMQLTHPVHEHISLHSWLVSVKNSSLDDTLSFEGLEF